MTLTPEKFARVFDLFACGVALVAPNGLIKRCNRIFAAIVGREVDEVQGRLTYQALTHPPDLEADELAAEQVKAGNIDMYEVHKRYVLPSGELVPVHLVILPLRAPDGEFRAFVGLVTDMSGSQRHRVIEALRDLEVHNARVRALLEGRDLAHLVDDLPSGG